MEPFPVIDHDQPVSPATPLPESPPVSRIPELTDPFIGRFPYYYICGMTLFTGVYLFYASFIHDYAQNEASTRLIDTIVGFLLGVVVSAIMQFLFGSSVGSKRKDEALAAAAKKPPAT